MRVSQRAVVNTVNVWAHFITHGENGVELKSGVVTREMGVRTLEAIIPVEILPILKTQHL